MLNSKNDDDNNIEYQLKITWIRLQVKPCTLETHDSQDTIIKVNVRWQTIQDHMYVMQGTPETNEK